MSYLPIASDLAVRATRNAMNGATPEPPTRQRPRRKRRAALRLSLAAALHRAASWVEPAETRRPGAVVGGR